MAIPEHIPSPVARDRPAAWIPASEAARLLACSARSVRRRCATGELVARQVGSTWYVDPQCEPVLRLATRASFPGPTRAGCELADLTGSQRRRVADRLAIVRDLEAMIEHRPEGLTVRELMTRFCESRDDAPAPGTLYRWLRAWRERGVAGLIDGRRGPSAAGRPVTFSPEAKDFIKGLYLKETRPSIPYIYTIALAQAREHGWALPALRTVQQWIKERVDPKLIAAARHPKQFRDRCLPYIERDWTQVAANECWIADHRQFDVLLPRRLYNPKKRRDEVKWFRPWVTLWLDARSWMPVSRVIAWDSPDGDRVMASFAHGVEGHGAPSHAILDNGKDFRTTDFAGGRPRRTRKGEKLFGDAKKTTSMLEALGVQVHWAKPYNAKAKPVEVFFNVMAGQFDRAWPTYCGHRTDRKPEQLKGLRADRVDPQLNLQAFIAAFDRWLMDDYALRESPSKAAAGMSPLRAFHALRDPAHRAVRPAAETLALLQTRSRRVRVETNGVWVNAFKRHYWHDSLEPRRAASGRDIKRHVVYRYRPGDPRHVWVFDFQTDRFLCVASPYAGEGVHPLAGGDALAESLSLQTTLGRETNAEAKRLREQANNVLLEAHRSGGAAGGLLDDPATIKRAAAPVLRLVADGELDRAAEAGRKAAERREATERAAALAATGTDDMDDRREPPREGPSVYDHLGEVDDESDSHGTDTRRGA